MPTFKKGGHPANKIFFPNTGGTRVFPFTLGVDVDPSSCSPWPSALGKQDRRSYVIQFLRCQLYKRYKRYYLISESTPGSGGCFSPTRSALLTPAWENRKKRWWQISAPPERYHLVWKMWQHSRTLRKAVPGSPVPDTLYWNFVRRHLFPNKKND